MKLSSIFRSIELWGLLISVLSWVLFIATFGFWPFISFSNPIIFFLTVINGFVGITSLRKWQKPKKGWWQELTLFLTTFFSFFCFIFCLFAVVVSLTWTGNYYYTEISKESYNNHNYHLVANPCYGIDDCYLMLDVYKCDFFNLVCPSIRNVYFHKGGGGDTVVLYDQTAKSYNVRLARSEVDKLSLKVDPAQNQWQFILVDKVVYTFSLP